MNKNKWKKKELGRQEEDFLQPMMIIEPNGQKKDFLFLPGKISASWNYHSSVNEKPLYFKLSVSPVNSVYYSPLSFLCRSFNRVLFSLLCGNLHVSNHGCRLQMAILGWPRTHFCWWNNWQSPVLHEQPFHLKKTLYSFFVAYLNHLYDYSRTLRPLY